MNSGRVGPGVEEPSKTLASNGNDAFKCFAQVCNPGDEAVLERLPIQTCKQYSQRIMTWGFREG